MRANDIITLKIYNGSTWVDYTDGLIDVQIIRGAEQYAGPFTQPDVGQLTIKTRNQLLDPYNNPDIKYNSLIRIDADSIRIFTGRIEGINVDYRPATEPTIVTINAIDMIGTLYKHILSTDFVNNHANWDMTTLLSEIESTGEVEGYSVNVNQTVGTIYSTGPIAENTSALEALSIRAKTDLGFMFANARNEIEYYRIDKDDVNNPYNARPSALSFKYDGTGTSYRTISLNDGFDKIVNEVVITGIGTSTTSTSDESVAVWGKTAATVNLSSDNLTNLQTIASDLLVEMSEPVRDIYEISWDATLDPTTAHDIDLLDNVYIDHKVNETTSIQRKYSIVGMKHEINADDWIVTYKLRNVAYQTTASPNPIISISPASGTQYIPYTFSYAIENPSTVASVYWDLDDGFTSTLASPVIDYTISGTKTITLTITTIYGYTKTVTVPLEVASSAPLTTFTYVLDSDKVYNFTFTGEAATSYNWDFGDGTTSSEVNPRKYYLTSGTRTISLTATNSIGSNTTSITISTQALVKIPVRYVRFTAKGAVGRTWNQLYYAYQNGPNGYGYIDTISMTRTNTPAIGSNYDIIDYEEYTGFFAEGPQYGNDDYNRTKRLSADTFRAKVVPGGDGVIYPMYYGAPSELFDPTHQSMTFTVDLRQEYFDFVAPVFTKSATNTIGNWQVDVSRDKVNWYNYGTLNGVTSATSTTFTYTSFSPATYALPAAPAQPDYYPVQFVRLTTNTPTATTGNQWWINEIIPFQGDGDMDMGTFQSYTGYTIKYPVDSAFSLGGHDLQRSTGAVTTLANTTSGPITNQSTGTGVYPGSNLSTYTNYKNLNTAFYWSETSGTKVFLIDFGKTVKKMSGIYIDWRTNTKGYPTTPPNTDYKMTVEISSDGTTWKNLGEYSIFGGNGAVALRTPAILFNNGNFPFYPPVKENSTLEKIVLSTGDMLP